MILLSEYENLNRRGEVYYRAEFGDFAGVGYIDGLQRSMVPFRHETDAENWCEDWVLLNNAE